MINIRRAELLDSLFIFFLGARQVRNRRIVGLTPTLGKDDIAGGVMMGVFIILVSAIIATAAAVFERILQNAVNEKSENDLAV